MIFLNEDKKLSTKACNECRKRRVKCDKVLPFCLKCTSNERKCSYEYIYKRRGPISKVEKELPIMSFSLDIKPLKNKKENLTYKNVFSKNIESSSNFF